MLNSLAYLRPASAGSNGPGLLGSIGFEELSDRATGFVDPEFDGCTDDPDDGDLIDISFCAEASATAAPDVGEDPVGVAVVCPVI